MTMKFTQFRFLKSIVLLLPFLLPGYVFADVSISASSQISTEVQSQQKTISGKVYDDANMAIPGATILVKRTGDGTVTDLDGAFTLSKVVVGDILVVSYVGMESKNITVSDDSNYTITLGSSAIGMDELIVVGYGIQKKETVVGAIAQTKGSDLMKSGGVSNVTESLEGKLPGVTTLASSGVPGDSDPLIFIRGQSSWNGGGQPLILVDGIERSMSDIDANEIQTVSVLKDASATAVYGVKGGNGVILITTKRGQSGKANLSLSANATMKTVSKLPQRVNSYDATMIANESILRELSQSPSSWNDYMPYEDAQHYINPSTDLEREMYPDVDWTDYMLKDFATDYRVNLSVNGGSDFAKYFTSFSYQHVSDIFDSKAYDNNKGYESEFNYNRFNYRSNLDFNISKTTKLSVNLSGYYGLQKQPGDGMTNIITALYTLPTNIYTPRFSDGYYGYDGAGVYDFWNPLVKLTSVGYQVEHRFQVNSDFILEQKLDFLLEGLTFKGRFSLDNNMKSYQNLSDEGLRTNEGIDNAYYRYYDNGNEVIESGAGVNGFDYVILPWTRDAVSVYDASRSRRMFYQFSLDYNKTFADIHDVSALFLMNREEYAIGDMFPTYREDWVGRLTYNVDSKYFLDVNGAYNGSEKFGEGYRFQLFPSAAIGWMISNESFMNHHWMDKFKLRGSYGLVGDDNFDGRWKYMTTWASGGNAFLVPSSFGASSPYTFYRENQVGNPDLHWETATKANIGLEFSAMQGLFTFDLDLFNEHRTEILITGSERSVPDFFGTSAPDANSGEVDVKGYEMLLGSTHTFDNSLRAWGKFSLTYAKDEIIYKEDPVLRPDYLKSEGFPISSNNAPIPGDILTNWDEIYMAVPLTDGQESRRPGYYELKDYNADGNYQDAYDDAPFGYPDRPQTNWFVEVGAEYRGFSFMVEFFGTRNANRQYGTQNLSHDQAIYFEHSLDYWSVDNPNGSLVLAPWKADFASSNGTNDYYDASVIRLKNVELAYSFSKVTCQRLGVSGIKLFVNGNNLLLWSDMPDDRSWNGDGAASYRGNYPTLKRVNLGMNLNF